MKTRHFLSFLVSILIFASSVFAMKYHELPLATIYDQDLRLPILVTLAPLAPTCGIDE